MRRFRASLTAVLMMFLLPMAHSWARGGGGGGGFGGVVGGLGGGFGGFRAAGGAHGSDRGGFDWAGLGVTVAAALLVYFLSERVRKARMKRTMPCEQIPITIVAVLDKGAHYVPALRALAARSRFGTPAGRAKARASLAALVAPEDVRGGFLRRVSGTGDACQVGPQARKLWQHQMHLAEITPEVLNVSSSGEEAQRREHPARREGVGVCVVGVVTTFPAGWLPTDGGRDKACEALRRLKKIPGDVFYFYYAPGTGEALELSEANALLARLWRDK